MHLFDKSARWTADPGPYSHANKLAPTTPFWIFRTNDAREIKSKIFIYPFEKMLKLIYMPRYQSSTAYKLFNLNPVIRKIQAVDPTAFLAAISDSIDL
jgi:hypothetical protein